MKLLLPTQAGRAYQSAVTVSPPGYVSTTATPEQEADYLSGKTWYDPATKELSTPPPVVPREIANWRARAILEIEGLLGTVETLIAGMEGPEDAVVRTAWERGAPLARNGPTVITLAAALDPPLTPEQLDEMFVQAAALKV